MAKGQVIILAGGKGTRLRPFTNVLPKPLMPLGDYSIAEIIIRQLKYYGLKNIVISTGHRSDLIQSYFGKGSRWAVNIRYVHEKKALGTAGAITLANNMEDDFIVINGDVLTDINFSKLIAWHKKRKAMATITIRERIVKTDFGVIVANGKDELVDYIEKPEHCSFVSMGINILNKKCRQFIGKNESLGMPELMLRLKDKNKKVLCHKTNATWLDLGRLDDFERAQNVFKNSKKKFLRPVKR